MIRDKAINICNIVIDWSIILIIFLTPVYFAFFLENFNIFELNKLVVFRIFLTFGLLAFLGKIFLSGRVQFKINTKTYIFVSLVAISFLFSTIFSIHPNLSLWGDYDRQQGYYSFFSYVLFFVLVSLNLRAELIKRLLVAVTSSALLVSLYGLAQYFSLDFLDWKESASLTGRVFSSLGQPNFLGQYLIMVLPVSFYLLVRSIKEKSKWTVSLAIGFSAVASLACLVFTYSRSAWLAALACLFVFLLYLLRNYKKTVFALISVALLCFVLLVYQGIYSPKPVDGQVNIIKRAASIFNFQQGSNKIRLMYWQAAVQEFSQADLKRKLFGYGGETLSSVFAKHYTSDWGVYEKINSFPDRAHNSFFDLLLQFGLLGLAAVVFFYIFLAVISFKFLRKNFGKQNETDGLIVAIAIILIGYFINNLFSFSLTVGYIYLYLFLAILLFLMGREKEVFVRLTPFSKIIIFSAFLVVSGFFLLFQNINALKADHYYMLAKKAEAKGDCALVLKNVDKTLEYNPASTFYKERFLYYYTNCFSLVEKSEYNNIHDNLVSEINSIDQKEYEYSTMLNIAHAESLLGFYISPVYYRAAEENYLALIEANSYVTSPYKDLGRMKIWLKDYGPAVTFFQKAIEVAPPLGHKDLNEEHKKEISTELSSIYEMMGLAFFGQGKDEDAIAAYKKALELNDSRVVIYKSIADIYYKEKKFDQAIEYNRLGMAKNPSDYNWYLAIALLYREKGDNDSANKYFDRALILSPDNEEIKKQQTNFKK